MLHALLPLLASASSGPLLLVPTSAPEAQVGQAIDGRLRAAAGLTFLDEVTTNVVLEDGRALGVDCGSFDVACLGKLGSLAEVEGVVSVIVSNNLSSGGARGALVVVTVVDAKTGEARRRTAQVSADAANLVDVAVDTTRAVVLGDAAVSAAAEASAPPPPPPVEPPPPPDPSQLPERPAPTAPLSSSSGLPLGLIVGGAGLTVGALAALGAGSMELMLASPSGTYEERGAWQALGRGLAVVAGAGIVVGGAGFALMAAGDD